MPHHARPRPPTPRIATRAELLELGWTSSQIQQQVQHGRWRRAARGTYVTDLSDTADPRTALAAALKAHGPDAVAILSTAAGLYGLDGVWPATSDVEIALPPGTERHQQPGVVVHTRQLQSQEIVVRDGFRTTSVARTVVDLVCSLDRFAAVSVIDSALQRRLLTPADAEHLRLTTVRRRGARRSRAWWLEADGRSQSPLETRVRLLATDAGYPPDELQLPIVVQGRVVAYCDLAWRQPNGRWLVGEADGERYHDTPQALFQDRTRANLIAGTGEVDVVRFTWRDTGQRPTIATTLGRFLVPIAS